MKKSTFIVIAIVYIASIVFISVFGLKTVIYNEVIPVTQIVCLNETDSRTIVTNNGNKKLIQVDFTEPGNIETLTGTMLQLSWRVLPDNASNKQVKFVYDTQSTNNVNFIKDDDGNDLGLILFSGRVSLDIKIMSTDGSRVYSEVTIWAR